MSDFVKETVTCPLAPPAIGPYSHVSYSYSSMNLLVTMHAFGRDCDVAVRRLLFSIQHL
jgi:hypothetical protein